MFFYFIYEILIKKYDVNVKKYYPLEEIVIKNFKKKYIEKIYKDEEFNCYYQIENIV
jgi:hypothetical protein